MNVLSLFTGIGGLDLGVKIAVPEARVVCCVERDAYCRRVLAARMADGSLDACPVWDDVTTFDGRPWNGCVDLICGGFPCQDLSLAGRRAGIQRGNRSGLWYEFARIIGEVGPRFVFVENVAALVNGGLDLVLGSLADLGYDAVWGVVSAADAGAPQLRKRLFLLAYSDRERQSQPKGRVGSSDVAHARCRRDHAEQSEPLAGRTAAPGPGGFGSPLADAEGDCGELRSAAGERSGRSAGDGRGGGAVGHAAQQSEREQDDAERAVAWQQARADAGWAGMFPPGPGDRDGWERFLAAYPEAEPAVAGRLNPIFVEALMGMPEGWVSLYAVEQEPYVQWQDRSRKALRTLQCADGSEAVRRSVGGSVNFPAEKILWSSVCEPGAGEAGPIAEGVWKSGQKASEAGLRDMRDAGAALHPSRGPELAEQRSGEPQDALLLVPYFLASCRRGHLPEAREAAVSILRQGILQERCLQYVPDQDQAEWDALPEDVCLDHLIDCGVIASVKTHRVDQLRCLGNGVVPQCAALAWRILFDRLHG